MHQYLLELPYIVVVVLFVFLAYFLFYILTFLSEAFVVHKAFQYYVYYFKSEQ